MHLEASVPPRTACVFRNCSLLDERLLNMPKCKKKKKHDSMLSTTFCQEEEIRVCDIQEQLEFMRSWWKNCFRS